MESVSRTKHVSNLSAHYYLSRIYTTSSVVCSQDRVNGVLQGKKIIPFARKGKMTNLPHPLVGILGDIGHEREKIKDM
jgi:hypothetical protein